MPAAEQSPLLGAHHCKWTKLVCGVCSGAGNVLYYFNPLPQGQSQCTRLLSHSIRQGSKSLRQQQMMEQILLFSTTIWNVVETTTSQWLPVLVVATFLEKFRRSAQGSVPDLISQVSSKSYYGAKYS